MKHAERSKTSVTRARNQAAMRGGTYSLVITVVVLAILILVNVLAAALPATLTKLDISASKLYSITSNTKVVVNALEQDVTIYWVVQSGQEDAVIENLLNKYDSLSDHISVVKKNPDVFPTFAEQYTSEKVANNSLIVESGEKSRFIAYSDIYLQNVDMYSYSYTTSFDGEGAITSAIDYVVRAELPKLYLLEGHGEAALPETIREQIEKDNIETASFSLLTADGIPEDAACLMIYAPQSDISSEEKDMLADHIAQGGKLLVAAGPAEDGILENLSSLLSDYGVETVEGIVVENDRQHYALQRPFVLVPEMESHAITDPLREENYYVYLPLSSGLTVNDSTGRVTTLLSTSDQAFSKLAGYDLATFEKEEGDIDGPFALAVSVETDGGGQMVWFASSYFLDDQYNAFSSGANGDMTMNALSALVGESEAMAIRSKSLNYNYLTINEAAASVLKLLMTGICPLVYLGVGIAVVVRRRRLQNAPV